MRVSRRDILFISSIGLPLVASQSCSNSTATAVAANGTPPTNPEQDLDRDFRVKFKVPKYITATTPEGAPTELVNGGNTDFVIMATWCPYSKQMKRFMNDPVTQPYIAKRKLIFLFSNDEWPTVRSELKDQVSATELDEEIAALKKKSGSTAFYDPSFLDDVPGDAYLCKIPPECDGFPSFISGSGRNKLGWMMVDLGMPHELMMSTYKTYAPKQQG